MAPLNPKHHLTTSCVLSVLLLFLSIHLPAAGASTTQPNPLYNHQPTPPATISPPTPIQPRSIPRDQLNSRYEAGSHCFHEGQYNCMTTSYQHCASGQWSGVTDCSWGTECIPNGLSMSMGFRPASGRGPGPGEGDEVTNDAATLDKGLVGWVVRGAGLW